MMRITRAGTFSIWIASVLVAGLASAASAGCGLFDTKDKKAGQKSSSSDGSPKLPCQKKGYPCKWSEVDQSTVERTLELSAKTSLRADVGSDWKRALKWIRKQPEVVDAIGSESAIRFRLENGRPVWVYLLTSYALMDGDPRASSSSGGGSRTKTSPLVVGAHRDERETKRGLIVTPSPNKLGEKRKNGKEDTEIVARVGQVVKKTLKKTRGYRHASGVKHVSGEDVTVDTFKGWGTFDTVYVNTHGACAGENCTKVSLGTGVKLGPEVDYIDALFKNGCRNVVDQREQFTEDVRKYNNLKRILGNTLRSKMAKQIRQRTETGLELALMSKCNRLSTDNTEDERLVDSNGNPIITDAKYVADDMRVCTGRYEYAVTAPFIAHHGGDTQNMMVVADGCETVPNGDSDLAEVFTESDGAFVGWPRAVRSQYKKTLPKFFQFASKRGVTGHEVLKDLEEKGLRRAESVSSIGNRRYCLEQRDQGPKLQQEPGDPRIRIREIVQLREPSGDDITDGETLTPLLDGIVGDGKPDALDVTAVVGGMDVSNGGDNAGEFSVHLEWEGEQIGPTLNVEEKGKKLGSSGNAPRRYRVSFDDIGLGTDVSADKQYRLAAVVELPEGGESVDDAEKLSFARCWARFNAGPIRYNSVTAETTKRFGSVPIGTDMFAVELNPTGNPKGAGVSTRGSWSGTGTYSVQGSVLSDKHEFDEPKDSDCNPQYKGVLDIRTVVGEAPKRLARGEFKTPVNPKPCDETEPQYALSGDFSLPIFSKQDAIKGGTNPQEEDWRRSCGGAD